MSDITLFCARCENNNDGKSLTVGSKWEASERYEWWEDEVTGEWYCRECTEVLRDQEMERRLK